MKHKARDFFPAALRKEMGSKGFALGEVQGRSGPRFQRPERPLEWPRRGSPWPSLMLTAALALTAPAHAQPTPASLPGVGATDPRRVVAVESPPWRALGRVQTELGERCTGFLIAPSLVVTAAHCLFLPRPQRWIRPGSVHFVLRYAAGRFAGHAVAAGYAIPPGYDPRNEGRGAGLDIALLHLAAPVGGADDILPLALTLPAPGTMAMLGGYGQDRAELIDADSACAVLGAARDANGHALIAHDCAGTRGTSGAPLLTRNANGRWMAAGVQVAARNAAAGGVAAPMTALAAVRPAS
jgi:protease YdgD